MPLNVFSSSDGLFSHCMRVAMWMTIKSEAGDSYGGAILKVFGFPQPEKINLMHHSDFSSGADGGWYAAWRVDTLLSKLKA